jgi:hypothetical protein
LAIESFSCRTSLIDTQCLANGLELSGLVAALRRARSVKTFRPEKYRGPSLPGRNNVLRFEEIEQMALSWKNITVARTNCGADVFGLAGFLRDDDLICHDGPLGRKDLMMSPIEHIMNIMDVQVMLNPNPDWASLRKNLRRVGGRHFRCLTSI